MGKHPAVSLLGLLLLQHREAPEPRTHGKGFLPFWKGSAVLSLERCRELLRSGDSMADDQVIRLRDQLYAIAILALDAAEQQGEPTLGRGPLDRAGPTT